MKSQCCGAVIDETEAGPTCTVCHGFGRPMKTVEPVTEQFYSCPVCNERYNVSGDPLGEVICSECTMHFYVKGGAE